jgi:dUTPase
MYTAPGLPDFSLSKHTKTGKIYQMITNYTKRPYIIPNGRKILQMVIKYNNILNPKALQNMPKFGFWV